MNAISDFVEVKNHTIKYHLPDTFDAKRVQLIIVPLQEDIDIKQQKKITRLKSLRGSITGQNAQSLNDHLQAIRKEWD